MPHIKSKTTIITVLVIVMIIVTFLFHVAMKQSGTDVVSDVLCIGAGVSSAYMCYKLKENGVHSTINVIESTGMVGGRLRSVYSNVYASENPSVIYDELGGMRIFKDEPMKEIFDLADKFGIELINVELEDKDNMFFYKGKMMSKKNVILSTGEPVKQLEETALVNLKHAYPDYQAKDVFKYEELRNISLREYLHKYANASDSDYKLWLCYYGYDYFTDDVQVAPWLYDNGYYSLKKSNQQYYIKNGMTTIVKELFAHSNANITCDTNAIYIDKDENGLNVVHTINQRHEYKRYKAKHLVIGITPRYFEQINTIKRVPISKERIELIMGLKETPLFKCFLKWDKKDIWWGEGKKFSAGKSTTDLIIRQVHYYNDEDILVYNTGSYATELNNRFVDNPAKAQKFVFDCIQKMHPFKIPEPNYTYTIFKYWPDGAAKWSLGIDMEMGCKTITDGRKDNSNIYIVGDSYSKTTGWVIGCLDSVNVAVPLIVENMR